MSPGELKLAELDREWPDSEKGRRMTRYMPIIAALVVATKAYAESSSTGAAEAAAIESALSWLKMVDAGNYAESWNETAESFRASVKKEQWPQMLTSVRKPLGKVASRKVLAKQYTESLPNAPKGKYVVIQFETAFESKNAVETVTPMLDKDGKWRVSGYYIK